MKAQIVNNQSTIHETKSIDILRVELQESGWDLSMETISYKLKRKNNKNWKTENLKYLKNWKFEIIEKNYITILRLLAINWQ